MKDESELFLSLSSSTDGMISEPEYMIPIQDLPKILKMFFL